jgi:hypothetical protein
MIYVYTCTNGHSSEVIHKINDEPIITCAACGLIMWRKPQAFSVNWGGPPPSAGGIAPAAQNLINSRGERLDKYQELKHK